MIITERSISSCDTKKKMVKYFFNFTSSFENWARFRANKTAQDIENMSEEEASKLLQDFQARND